MKKNIPGSQNKSGSFLNGKSQVIELLGYLTKEERDTLLKKIKILNPPLASELGKSSFHFEDLLRIDKSILKSIFGSFPPAITGVALKGTSSRLQQHILQILGEDYAQKANHVIRSHFDNELDISKKAKEKILSRFQNQEYSYQ